jgi:tetratricopeptide (TPR) repeat protein
VEYTGRYGWRNYKTYDRLAAEAANFNAAVEQLDQMIMVQGEKVSKVSARMINDLARALVQFLWFDGRWDERVQLETWAYEAMCSLNDWSEAGWRAYGLARVQDSRGNVGEAAHWTERCVEAWFRGGGKREQATGMRMRGLVSEHRKDYETAERWHRDALTIYRDLKDDEWTATVLNSLAWLERERKQYDIAERYYREALALAEKIDHKDGRAGYTTNLGGLALDRGEWVEARKWFEQGLALAKEVGRQELIAGAQYGLARVEEAEGRVDLALPLAQEALRIYERLQHKDLAEVRELVERLKGK